MTADDGASFRSGFRQGVPYALAGFLLSASFGVLAREAGMPAIAAIAMSVIVFAGSAQFAAISILASGGGLGAAVLAATLMNARYLPMGIALAPSLPGRPLKRAAQGQAVVDASWALASRGDGTFDRWLLFGTTAPQYVTWTVGTVAGVVLGGLLPDAHDLGLDAIFPAFFLSLLLAEMRRPGGRDAALLGAALALALVPFVPVGVPVLAASLAALLGLRRPKASVAP
jgi:4-azaleucine resistance transporter AzlC